MSIINEATIYIIFMGEHSVRICMFAGVFLVPQPSLQAELGSPLFVIFR